MIQRVRKSFIAITMTMLTLVLTLPLCALNIFTAALTYNNNEKLLEQIAQTEVYILEPRSNAPDDIPPTENHNIGVGKQQHTTEATTTAPTTASTSTTTITTTVKSQDPSQPGKNTTAAVPKESNTQGTTPPTENQPPTNGSAVTSPPPPDWEGDFTRPTGTRPNIDWPPQFHDDWEEDYNDDIYQDFGAVMFSSKIISIAKLLNMSYSSLENIMETTAPAVTSAAFSETAAATTTTTTTVTTVPSSENTVIVSKKVFNKTVMGHEPPDKNFSNTIDHFVVYLDRSGAVTDIHGTDDYTQQSCTQMIEEINNDKKYDGYYGSLQYVRKDYTNGAVVVFSDRQSDIKMLKTLLFVSIGVFILMEGIVFFLTKLLTKRAMRPIQVSYEKQQQFISDAGHELKTPLTVISANADILADEIGENKWLTYIKGQAERMRILVQEMLDLTKITNSQQHIAQSRFNISSLVENVALPFECQAFEQKKTFHIELEPDVEFFGNTERIRRMVGIFIDNAFKYSNENGTVKIQLKTENGKKVLKIYNTGMGIQKGDEEKIFERFYRSDSSRSTQGGYGLGLAIAKSIADQHGIKIQVQNEPGQWVSFNLYL